jgi:hypothetical protein
LIELVVALSAGIAVAGAAYILSKASLNAFEAEARMSQAQFSATMGLNRLANDIQRAGFMSNPNAQATSQDGNSPLVCGSTTNFQKIRAVQIFKGADAATAGIVPTHATNAIARAQLATYNGKAPDRLRLVGDYASTELFEFRTVQGTAVSLTLNDGPMQRTLVAAKNGAPGPDKMFRKGRYVRMIDSHGKESYSIISDFVCSPDCTAANVTSMTVTLVAAPNSNGMVCGDWVSGGYINPVNIIEYWVGVPTTADQLAQANLNLISAQAPTITGDGNRTELVRSELMDDGSGTGALKYANDTADPTYAASEIAAEYTVDFNIAATIRTNLNAVPVTLARLDGDTEPTTSFNNANLTSQEYVGLGVRLSTRTRAPDRDSPVASNLKARFDVFAGVTPAPATRWARVRTFTQEVNLPNLEGIKW